MYGILNQSEPRFQRFYLVFPHSDGASAMIVASAFQRRLDWCVALCFQRVGSFSNRPPVSIRTALFRARAEPRLAGFRRRAAAHFWNLGRRREERRSGDWRGVQSEEVARLTSFARGADALRIGTRTGGDDDARRRIDPSAVVGDAGVGADGANDGVARNFRVVAVLEQSFERGANVAVAAGVEADGARVAVDDAHVDAVVVADVVGMLPLDEFGLDFLALRVAADDALARVAGKTARGWRRWSGVAGARGGFLPWRWDELGFFLDFVRDFFNGLFDDFFPSGSLLFGAARVGGCALRGMLEDGFH